MSLPLGSRLSIRSMVYLAGETIPFFWPMRSFIHHNPLHGMENLPFGVASQQAKSLFHARTYLSRSEYQDYLAQGKVCQKTLRHVASDLAAQYAPLPGVDYQRWFVEFLAGSGKPFADQLNTIDGNLLEKNIGSSTTEIHTRLDTALIQLRLRDWLPVDKPLYETYDLLYGAGIGEALDEMVIKTCLDFYDEGQSVWSMPNREHGLYVAWSVMATRHQLFSHRAREIHRIISTENSPEGVIAKVMGMLKVPESEWKDYFTRELSRLHGWVGFIRWRENAKHYYWTQEYPGDLVDYLAIRLVLSAVMLTKRGHARGVISYDDIDQAIEQRPLEMYLRYELFSGKVYAPMAQQVEQAIASGNQQRISRLCEEYWQRKQTYELRQLKRGLRVVARTSADNDGLPQLNAAQWNQLLEALSDFERKEGQLWLSAMEEYATRSLVENLNYQPAQPREKRPFVQAMFCIDTRSERIRRQLESIGDYQTYGIAGFFGVPFSFLELGKGSENHLCPILLTPKNLVLEISRVEPELEPMAVNVFSKALHELKESIFSPFVTVEAIGLLFGFDMFGKTMAPKSYQHWRRHLNRARPDSQMLLDKLTREQADSIVRTVQRALIIKAVEHELEIPAERITDDLVRELRECALEHQVDCKLIRQELGVEPEVIGQFVERLKNTYRINHAYAKLQLESLGRIGFSLDEQAGFVSQALRSIGLTKQFSRFVLLVGHGSTSENNPYESALDCGACGGYHGLFNARILAQMANKVQVREKLRQQGLEIDDDVWFVPVLHNTTTDELQVHDLELLPSSHLVYFERLRNGLKAASRLCAKERLPELAHAAVPEDPAKAYEQIQRFAVDWSQVRPEWGLSGNAYFVIGQRQLTADTNLEGRSFLHSYDYRLDPKRRLLENILAGPLVVAQWINMEHYFSTVDNERFGSGSKVYHNVAGRFGVMTGNISDLRTGLPAQTVMNRGVPYHDPMRLITVIQAPLQQAVKAIYGVPTVKQLVRNYWVLMVIIDPETNKIHRYHDEQWPEITAFDEATGKHIVKECA